MQTAVVHVEGRVVILDIPIGEAHLRWEQAIERGEDFPGDGRTPDFDPATIVTLAPVSDGSIGAPDPLNPRGLAALARQLGVDANDPTVALALTTAYYEHAA